MKMVTRRMRNNPPAVLQNVFLVTLKPHLLFRTIHHYQYKIRYVPFV